MNDIDRLGAGLADLRETHDFTRSVQQTIAEDLAALDARLTEYQKSVAITSDRLTTQSQDMAALRKRIEGLEERLTGLTLNVDAFVREFREAQDALVKRVATLEGQGNRVGGTVPESSAVTSASPAPPAPLVERICLIFHKHQSPVRPGDCEMAKEALLVAAEELLGPVTDAEWAAAIAGHFSYQDCCSAILRARDAALKEAGL